LTRDQALRVLPVYRRTLARYQEEGDPERIAIQERLIARLERDAGK
jgi:hypothetical protein